MNREEAKGSTGFNLLQLKSNMLERQLRLSEFGGS